MTFTNEISKLSIYIMLSRIMFRELIEDSCILWQLKLFKVIKK